MIFILNLFLFTIRCILLRCKYRLNFLMVGNVNCVQLDSFETVSDVIVGSFNMFLSVNFISETLWAKLPEKLVRR